jgi:hypothetical protein
VSTGIRLSPGTYHVTANQEEAIHIYMPCNDDRQEPFEIDFTGVFFYFTVSQVQPDLFRRGKPFLLCGFLPAVLKPTAFYRSPNQPLSLNSAAMHEGFYQHVTSHLPRA